MKIDVNQTNYMKNISDNYQEADSNDYKPGKVIRAKLLSVSNGKAVLQTDHGNTLNAKIQANINFNKGEWVDYQIIERNEQRILLKPTEHMSQTQAVNFNDLLRNFNIPITAQNRLLLQFMLLAGIPLNQENIEALVKRHYGVNGSIIYLLSKARLKGIELIDRELLECLPSPLDMERFLKKTDEEIDNIFDKVISLYKELKKDKEHADTLDKVMKYYVSNLILQADNRLPYHYVEIPLRWKDKTFNNEIWVDSKNNRLFFKVELHNLGIVGCLIENWRENISINIYSNRKSYLFINGHKKQLYNLLTKHDFKIATINITYDETYGTEDFFNENLTNQNHVDIRI